MYTPVFLNNWTRILVYAFFKKNGKTFIFGTLRVVYLSIYNKSLLTNDNCQHKIETKSDERSSCYKNHKLITIFY